MSVVKVTVIEPMVYNGQDHRALPPAERGDHIEVANRPYADSLIADGYVAEGWIDLDVQPEPAETVKETAVIETEQDKPAPQKRSGSTRKRTAKSKEG